MRRAGRRVRGGFTLLEVLVALTLSTALLAGVYMALDLHYRYSTAGRDEAERSQLARALANRLAVDLRSVVYQAKPAPDATEETDESASATTAIGTTDPSSNGTSSTDSDEASEETTVMMDQSNPSSAIGTGLFGNGSTLLIHISQPSRTLEYAALGAAQPGLRTSDLQSVSWFVAREGSGGLQGTVAANQGEGLTRTCGDRLTSQLADESGNLQGLASTAQLLAPEVTAIQFQYFDGAGWLGTWDSDQLGGLPRAIEIRFEIQPSINQKNANPAPRTYRLVVPLPLAKPLPV